MANQEAGGDEEPTAHPSDETAVCGAGRERTTRRGVLAGAGALGVLPIAGLTGRRSADGTGTAPATSRDRIGTSDGQPRETVDSPIEVTLEFERLYDGREASAFTQTASGEYVIVGRESVDSIWLLWADAGGRPLVTRRYDTPGELGETFEIVAKENGGVVVLGTAFLGAWLLSVDADGDVCWLRYDDAYPRDFYVRYAHSLVRTAGGGYAWVTEPFDRPSDEPTYAHVVDEDGETVWQNSFTTTVPAALAPGSPRLRAIAQLDDGGFVLAGHVRGGDAPYVTHPYPLWVVRTDPGGERVHDALLGHTPGGFRDQFVNAAVHTEDGGIAIAGGEVTNRHPRQSSVLFRTVDADLESEVDRTYDPRACDPESHFDSHASSLVRVSDGGFVLAGTSTLCETENVEGTVGRLIGLTPDGSVRWTSSYPEDLTSSELVRCVPETGERRVLIYFTDIVQTHDGGIAALGRSATDGVLVKLTTKHSC